MERREGAPDEMCSERHPALLTRVSVDHEAPHPLAFTHLWAVIRLLPLALPPSPNLLNSSVSGDPGLGRGGLSVSHQT